MPKFGGSTFEIFKIMLTLTFWPKYSAVWVGCTFKRVQYVSLVVSDLSHRITLLCAFLMMCRHFFFTCGRKLKSFDLSSEEVVDFKYTVDEGNLSTTAP